MLLRIVVWNCAMALDSKFDALLALEPHLAIVPECAEPDILRRKAPSFEFRDVEWTGENPTKGLGVFAFDKLTLRRHQSWDRTHHIMIPVEVRGPIAVNLLAVWAFNHRVPPSVTPNPVTTETAIKKYAPFLSAATPLVAGDFNASAVWDKPRNPSFASLNQTLSALEMFSAYHGSTGEAFGEERSPTLFWQRKPEQKYHIDYTYVHHTWRERVRRVDVGLAEAWLKHSDHAPLLVEVDLSPGSAQQRNAADGARNLAPLGTAPSG